jgi:hypothetical protein
MQELPIRQFAGAMRRRYDTIFSKQQLSDDACRRPAKEPRDDLVFG